ncbi:tetratricopeptide repeat protein [Halomonas denitrificans]|nr:tetratricopeptide repeat protein [Halomonas denitrificans]
MTRRIVHAFALLLLAAALAGCGGDHGPTDAEIVRNNEGVALMGQYRNEEARAIFAELTAARPDWHEVRVNEAIATLNRQNEGDERRALAMAEAVLADDPGNPSAAYVAGLMHFYLGDAETALARFSTVRETRPDDPHVAYFAAQALAQLGRHDDALALYRAAIDLDPYLRSAYYGAALSLRQLGDADAARVMLADYQRFADNPRAHLAEFRYTRMGPLAEARAVGRSERARPDDAPTGPLFAEPLRHGRIDAVGRPASLTTADIDGDGAQDLLLAAGSGAGTEVWLQRDGAFERVEDHPLAGIADVDAVAWGVPDVSDDLAVYLCRAGENRMLQRSGTNWTPAAEDVLDDSGACADVAALDADHDGDLDWWLANADGPNELLSNNLDGSWRRLADDAEPLLAGPARPSSQVLATDLDGDGDADLVTLQAQPPHQVLVNDRLWQYREAEGFDAFRSHPVTAVVAGDLDARGRNHLFTIDAAGDLLEWQPDDAGDWSPRMLVEDASRDPAHAGLAVQDFDGDGRPDLLLHDGDGFRIHAVADGEVEVLAEEAVALRALVPVLIDPARGPALVGLVADGSAGVLTQWPAGPGRHGFLAIAPSGRSDAADGMRSNPSGIGTELLLRVGDRWTRVDAYGNHSARGQSLQPIAIGLGGAARADFVRLQWTDGVLQTEMALAGGEVHAIAEYQRQLSSCPVLFAFDGDGFEFVSDVLGVGGIGFLFEPGRYAEPRPWEFFRFPDGTMQPDGDVYRLKIAEPMQEIAYIDTARLNLYDLAAGWNLVLDERMQTGEPTVSGAPLFYRDDAVLAPVRAHNDRGENVLASLSSADFDAAPPGPRDPRFLGLLADEHVLTLEFGRVINPAGTRPVLKAFGWVEYPYSQTVFAAWQAGEAYRAPTLEARTERGWQVVHAHFGYPAGMPREMALPLDALPPGTTALRLRSNLEIYWDQLGVIYAEYPGDALLAVHRVASERARLAKTGFARRTTLAQRRPWYDYQRRSAFWDTEYPEGYYTRLGPVDPLVEAADDALALIGPGEELDLAFAAPPPAAGARRVVVLDIRGFAKDMDLYTDTGGRVGPLPSTPGVGDPEQRERLHAEFMTRYKGGF